MNLEILAIPAVILAFLTACILIISWDWRISIAALSLQYLSVFVLVSLSWPAEITVVKVVAGWIAGTVLGLAVLNSPKEYARSSGFTLSEIVFRLMAAILAGLFAFTGGAKLIVLLPEITLQQAQGGIILISLGLLHLGLTNHPLRVVIGLLTVLSGFEILYSAVESSILVTGLLASVTLGLAVVGAYLLTAPTLEESN
jgi:hypothetical protein